MKANSRSERQKQREEVKHSRINSQSSGRGGGRSNASSHNFGDDSCSEKFKRSPPKRRNLPAYDVESGEDSSVLEETKGPSRA